MADKENFDNDFDEIENSEPEQTLFEYLLQTTLLKPEFDALLKENIDKKISDFPKVHTYFENHKNVFEQKFNSALDKELLIQTEIERFDNYTNPQKLKELYLTDFVARGFKWANTGQSVTIKDFFHFLNETRPDYYSIFDFELKRETLEPQWLQVPALIDRAALGCSYALYVSYLKSIELNQTQTQTDETKGKAKPLSAWAKVLLLQEIGFFELPSIKNLTADNLAPIVAEIIANGANAHNLSNYIQQRNIRSSREGNQKKELQRIDKALAAIGIEPGK